jgi:hypothetical protein
LPQTNECIEHCYHLKVQGNSHQESVLHACVINFWPNFSRQNLQ